MRDRNLETRREKRFYMRTTKLLSCVAAAFAAASLFADAGNTLITFSTVADKYADGVTPVADGEWYALCWSADGEFNGITSECEPVDTNDKIFLMAPLAKNGRCPTVVFQLDSTEAPSSGVYCIYLLDTRGADNTPAKAGATRKPSIVRAAVATDATASGSAKVESSMTVQSDANLSTTAGGDVAWGASAVDESKIGQPVITAFKIEGEYARITVENMHSSILYNVFSGATPSSISTTPVSVPKSPDNSNSAEFFVPKSEGQFFKVARQPVK